MDIFYNSNNKENESLATATTSTITTTKAAIQQQTSLLQTDRIPLQNIHNIVVDSVPPKKRNVSFSPSTSTGATTDNNSKPSSIKRKKNTQMVQSFAFTTPSVFLEHLKERKILQEDQLEIIRDDISLGCNYTDDDNDGNDGNDGNDFITLFKAMEINGFLFYEVLELFCNCPFLKDSLFALQLSTTYAEVKKDKDLWNSSPTKVIPIPHHNSNTTTTTNNPALPLTKPLFNGRAWRSLQVLDLSCLSLVRDEELRYIIRLPNILALGLSMTRVTSRGIRYLGRHSLFKDKLQCLKLCHLQDVDDRCIAELSSFPSLNEVDLYGCDSKSLTLSSLLRIDKKILKIRLPLKHSTYLEEMHNIYRGININLKHKISNSQGEIRNQLRLYQNHYADVFLNLDIISHEQKLRMILERRSLEECLYERINK